MIRLQRILTPFVAICLSFAGFMHSAQASLISTEQIVAGEGIRSATEARALVSASLERADVVAALQERGVSIEQARARVAALTDAQAAQVAADIDSAPVGASDVIGTVVFIFIVLLVTDILGFTKIFPFTRSIR